MTDTFEKILTDHEQNILDGESLPVAAAAGKALPEKSGPRDRVAAFVEMEKWLHATRSEAPSLFYQRVVSAIQRDIPEGRPGQPKIVAIPLRKRASAAVGLLAAAAALFVAFQLGQVSNPVVPPGPEAANRVSESPVNTVRYEFIFRTSEAQEVCIAGNFNHWKVCETPLQRVGEDLWSVSVELPQGRHEYMFVVDGHWVSDPTASGYVQDGFGNQNAVLQL